MSLTRRELLQAGSAAAVGMLVGGDASAQEPTLGLIFPPLNYPMPPDPARLYPKGVKFVGTGVGLPGGMTLEGYEEAVPRIVPAAEELAKQGAQVISVFGSSLTFYKGAKFNEELTTRVTKATGKPATTQSNGLVDGLKVANARRVAVATAYTQTVTERLKFFLEEHGFLVTVANGMGFERVPANVTQDMLYALGVDTYSKSGMADALIVSCGGLRTLDLIVPLEAQIKVPVVSSTPHGLMNGVRMLGRSPRANGFGMVFSKA